MLWLNMFIIENGRVHLNERVNAVNEEYIRMTQKANEPR